MRILMIADESFARREHAMLRRLQVGLIDEGARILQAWPRSLGNPEGSPLITQVSFEDKGSAISLSLRARRLIRDAAQAEASSSGQLSSGPLEVDVVHGFGPACWAMSAEVARLLEVPLALDVSSDAGLARIADTERRLMRGTAGSDAAGVWIAPDQAMADALTGSCAWPVRVVPWGVHVPRELPRLAAASQRMEETSSLRSACVFPSGSDAEPLCALLEGLKRYLETTGNQVLVFFDDRSFSGSHSAWRHAERLGLLESISVVAGMESRRDLVLHADILIHPDARGEHRTLTLDAMASGLVVVALADELVSWLVKDQTAIIVAEPRAELWEAALARSFDRSRCEPLLRSAHRYVSEHHVAHAHVQGIRAAYLALTGGFPHTFAGS